MTLRRALPVVLALRTHNLLDFALHRLIHDRQAETETQREQPNPRRPDKLAEPP